VRSLIGGCHRACSGSALTFVAPLLLVGTVFLAGCGGRRSSNACRTCAGIAHDAETYDGDVPLIEHLWKVCDQDPGWGAHASYVVLYVARDCD
jgi:hypothetical protein